MQHTTVVKVKMYNMEGLTVFSTDTGQIGEDKRNHLGFMAAAEGRIWSEITHRDRFSAFDGMIFSRDLYRFDTDTANRNFLERLVQNETGNAMVTRFTSDLWKLAQEGGMTMAPIPRTAMM